MSALRRVSGCRGDTSEADPRGRAPEMEIARAAFHHLAATATEADLGRGMHYPTRWDPFFTDYMTLADVYRFPTRHFHFHHQQQLNFEPPPLQVQ